MARLSLISEDGDDIIDIKDDDDDELVVPMDVPLTEDIFDPELDDIPVINMTEQRTPLPYEERVKIAAECMRLNFDVRAVVVRADVVGRDRINPQNWGIVTQVVTYGMGGRFAPIEVKWLDRKHLYTYHYPQELVLCMYPPDDIDLQSIMEDDSSV